MTSLEFLPLARRLVREAIKSRPNRDFEHEEGGRRGYIEREAESLAYLLHEASQPRLAELAAA